MATIPVDLPDDAEDSFFDDVVPEDKPWPTQLGLFDEIPCQSESDERAL